MIDTGAMDAWLATRRETHVDVIIAGRLFGGCHGESPQIVKSYELRDSQLVIYFGTTETLIVDHPHSVRINERNELLIPQAREVLWGWHYHGREQSPENWCTRRYSISPNGMVSVTEHGPAAQFRSRPQEAFRYDGEEAVKLS